MITAFDLTGRTAIVTGAGSGIGQGIATILAAAGATVVCADLDGAAASATAKAVGGSAATVDVSRRDQVRELVAATDRLDIMVNNAGIMIESSVLDITEETFDKVLAVNLKGVLFGCQEAGAVMQRQGSGSIVNMSSGAHDSAAANMVAYSVSKSGVVQVTRTLARELGPDGVRVNAIAPGLVETGITQRHFRTEDGTIDEDQRGVFLTHGANMAPLRTMGTPEDIAYAALYLASDAARFVTGQIIRPNGGVTMP